MADEMYISPTGFKCVKALLQKTEGRDPQEYEQAKRNGQDVKVLKVRVAEYIQ